MGWLDCNVLKNLTSQQAKYFFTYDVLVFLDVAIIHLALKGMLECQSFEKAGNLLASVRNSKLVNRRFPLSVPNNHHRLGN